MRILFLYSEYVNYQDGLLNSLRLNHGAQISVVSWDKNLLKPQNIPRIPGVVFHKRTQLGLQKLIDLIEVFEPNVVYISGWMDSGYLRAVSAARNRNSFLTVCGFDDNWSGSLRQQLGSIFFKIFLRRFFDAAWVAGARQYNYARNLGYTDKNIAFNLLSCDTTIFGNNVSRSRRPGNESRKFFYVGNFIRIKGIELLADAYKIYRNRYHGKSELICIGQGELEARLKQEPGILVLPYMSSSDLINLSQSFDIFVFPSIRDQWGVALHEFSLLGFPILSSTGAGATDAFLIDRYNGLLFTSGNAESLASKLYEFDKIPDHELQLYGNRSRNLARSINSEISAASLVSLVSRLAGNL